MFYQISMNLSFIGNITHDDSARYFIDPNDLEPANFEQYLLVKKQ